MEILSRLAHFWWLWMSSMLWQASLLVVIVGSIDILIRRWVWPQVRYTLWLLIFIKLLIPPGWSIPTGIITGVMPSTREYLGSRWESTFPGPAGASGAGTGAAETGERVTLPGRPAGEPGPAAPDIAQSEVQDRRAGQFPVQVALMGIWLAGIAIYAILLTVRMRKLKRWHREQVERKTIPAWFHDILVDTGKRLGIERLPAIVFSNEAVTPAVYGVFRPVLLLPTRYSETLSKEEADDIIMHELAHIKRGDLWVHGATIFLQIVYWFNPLLLWASRQVKHIREICCDITIAGYLKGKTDRYRKTLLDTARELLTESPEPGMGLLGVFEEPFWLVARIRWLEKRTWERRAPITASVILLLLIMIPFVLPMAASGPDNFSGTVSQPQGSGSADSGKVPPAGRSGNGPADTTAAGLSASTIDSRGSRDPGEAAWLVRDVTREYIYLMWFLKSTRVISIGETWFGDGRIALEENGKRYILDRSKNILIYINHRRETYVEISLPVDRSGVISDRLKWRFQEVQYEGDMKKTRSTREYMDKICTKYYLATWEMRGDVKGSGNRIEVWTTMDVPFDVTLLHDLMNSRRILTPRSPRLVEEMKKLEGLQMIIEQSEKRFPYKTRYATKIVEIAREKTPDGIFEIPEGYEKKERLDPDDL